jgi:hypothetical protein
MQFEFSFLETILWTNVGGILGIYFFAFLSEKLIAWWNRNFRRSSRSSDLEEEHKKKVFTKRNRRIVTIKQRYGLIGIAVSTPFLLSIPVGVFLVVRYYRSSRSKFLLLIASNVFWSINFSAVYMFWDGLLFQRS